MYGLHSLVEVSLTFGDDLEGTQVQWPYFLFISNFQLLNFSGCYKTPHWDTPSCHDDKKDTSQGHLIGTPRHVMMTRGTPHRDTSSCDHDKRHFTGTPRHVMMTRGTPRHVMMTRGTSRHPLGGLRDQQA
ncbi:hypothetical protein Taro_053353 [Colocasia esculenta]|uniref:Uncharacterized protein n=1 Tax=Colocasia esculenta TaxID=4460 RepID=A0A843XMT5_COLES|nr:hypothetical protein [Colocasia esculenta]